MVDFNKAIAAAIEAGADHTKTTAGGGEREIPVEGPCRVRFVSYIETGRQKGTYQGKPRVQKEVILGFELSGPKHPPMVNAETGEKYPHRIDIKMNHSLNEKAGFSKLFKRMNYGGKAVHMAQLLGEGYAARVYHRTYKGKDGVERKAWDLSNKDDGMSISPPRYELTGPDGPTGEFAVLPVDPQIAATRLFLWDHPDMDQWASIFIDGEYEERKNDKGEVTAPAKSKNRYQIKIRSAENFATSPLYVLLANAGQSLDIPSPQTADDEPEDEAEGEDPTPAATAAPAPVQTPSGAAADDALSGIVA